MIKIPSPEELRKLLLNPPVFIGDVMKGAAQNEFATIRHPNGRSVSAIVVGGDLLSNIASVFSLDSGGFIAVGSPSSVSTRRRGDGLIRSRTKEVSASLVDIFSFNVKFLYIDNGELFVFDGQNYLLVGSPVGAMNAAIANMGNTPSQWNGWAEYGTDVVPFRSGASLPIQALAVPHLHHIGQGWGLSVPIGELQGTEDYLYNVKQSSLNDDGSASEATGVLETEHVDSGYPNWRQNTEYHVDGIGGKESFVMTANNDGPRNDFLNNGPWSPDYPYCPSGPTGIRVHIAIPLTNANTPSTGPNANDDWHKGLKHYNYTPSLNLLHTSNPIEFVPGNSDDTAPWLNWRIPGASAGGVIIADPLHPDYQTQGSATLPCGFARQQWNDSSAPSQVTGDIRLYTRTFRLSVTDWGGEFMNLFGGQTYQSFEPCSSEACILQYLNAFLGHETASGPLQDHVWIVELEGQGYFEASESSYCGGLSCPVEWDGPPPPPSFDSESGLPDFLWRQILLRSVSGDSIHVNYSMSIKDDAQDSQYLNTYRTNYIFNDEMVVRDETPLIVYPTTRQTLRVGGVVNFDKIFRGFEDGIDNNPYHKGYFQGWFPTIGLDVDSPNIFNGPALIGLEDTGREIASGDVETRFTEAQSLNVWDNITGQPAIVYDNILKKRADGIITISLREEFDGEISIEGFITINAITDAPWNSVHSVFGASNQPQILYLNNGSISQFLHAFGDLSRNITWVGNNIYIASNPDPFDEEVYVERWIISDNGPLVTITQTSDLFVETIPQYNPNGANEVFSTSYFPGS